MKGLRKSHLGHSLQEAGHFAYINCLSANPPCHQVVQIQHWPRYLRQVSPQSSGDSSFVPSVPEVCRELGVSYVTLVFRAEVAASTFRGLANEFVRNFS